MKSYEEVAKSVFEKSEKYFVQRWRRLRQIKIAVSTLSCICLTAVIITAAVLGGNLSEYPAGANGQPAGNVDVPDYVWQTPEEIIGDNTPSVNEAANYYIVYNGALYECSSDSETDSHFSEKGRYYALTGRYAYSHGVGFPCEVYAVKDEPDLIMIEKDYVLFEYTKIMDCNFEVDGEKFEIACSLTLNDDYGYGDMVLQTEDFTVYETVQVWNSVYLESKPKAYLINIYPVLVRKDPNLYKDLVPNYPDYPPENIYFLSAWWLALPCEAADEMSRVEAPHGDPDFLIKTLSDVSPADIDSILAPAAAAAYSAASGDTKSVFVTAETGSEVYSLVDGVVVTAEYDDAYGYIIEVDIGNGKSVKHYHLSEMLAEVGDTVTRGQVIGLAGTTETTSWSDAGYIFITDK